VTCTDEDLLRACAAGNTAAFDALVARHETVLYRLAHRICGSASEAEDALQDGLLHAWRGAGSYRGDGTVAGWLLRVVLHACRHRQRRRAGEPRRHDPLDEVTTVAAKTAGPELSILQAELGEALEAALAQLDEDARTVLLLRDVEGFCGADVASALGTSMAAMKSRLHRARLELKRCVESRLGKAVTEVLP